ncbi:thioesterase family protein [Mammaliicoccus sciuri]|uniref:thioesterase family protein n=1 Tax=Mammaliicoccus sciuri TaxID=1296 RepID=UPI003F56AC82
MNSNKKCHPLDSATELFRKSDIYYGCASKSYANMIGQYGGITAAIILKSIINHPKRNGEPISLTINYASPVLSDNFTVKSTPIRTNRSTQHWYVEMFQNKKVVITGTAVFSARRQTWSTLEAEFPDVPSIETIKSTQIENMPPWLDNYDIRTIKGVPKIFSKSQGTTSDSITIQWMKDYPKRKIDFLSLTAMCDAFLPRIYVKRDDLVPIGTVSLTIYYHVDSKTLEKHGDKEILGCARSSQFYNGFFDQTAELWTPEGQLLATTSQIVYYKE